MNGFKLASAVFLSLAAIRAAPAEDSVRFATYMTSDEVISFFTGLDAGKDPLPVFERLHIRKVCIEAYRGGVVVPPDQLRKVKVWFEERGIQVVGGIATVPGGDFGVKQVGALDWFNWQSEKTQRDLKAVMEAVAPIFDTFVIDDFLCTGDESQESLDAKGERSWSDYRRDLMVRLAREVFIEPAKRINPGITMIIKYPQWYDRFQMFGYDVPRQSAQFDQTWVGTETRGASTQRFGFTQPYEGFVNYRYIKSIAGERVTTAWFDHGDCDANDFLDQAYMTVLAGAPEIVLFNYGEVVAGHPGHDLLAEHMGRLQELAAAVKEHPLTGIPAYKPPNNDAGGDLYIMDFLGMLGVPLAPVSEFPTDAREIILPTQAASDPDIASTVDAAIERGTTLILTAGFLATAQGLPWKVTSNPVKAESVIDPVGGKRTTVENLTLESREAPRGFKHKLVAEAAGVRYPLMSIGQKGTSTIIFLNIHTYSQADFDAVGETLLSPRPLSLLDLPSDVFTPLRMRVGKIGPKPWLEAPARVTFQPLGDSSWFLLNNSAGPAKIELRMFGVTGDTFEDALTGELLRAKGRPGGFNLWTLSFNVEGRGYRWIRPVSD